MGEQRKNNDEIMSHEFWGITYIYWGIMGQPLVTVLDVWSRRAVKKFLFGYGLPVSFSGFTIKTILRMREF